MGPVELCSDVPAGSWMGEAPRGDSAFGGSPLLSGQQHQHKARHHAAGISAAGELGFHSNHPLFAVVFAAKNEEGCSMS